MEHIKSSRIIDQAKHKVNGFVAMFERLEQKVTLGESSFYTLYASNPYKIIFASP